MRRLQSPLKLALAMASLGLLASACSLDELNPRKIRRKLRRARRKARAENPDPLPPPIPGDQRPNVILVTLDTVRADALGAYGAPQGRTPALDRIAAEGTVFTQSWSQAPSTSATHASLFTGARIYEHGLIGHTVRLPRRWTTLAEHFQAEGYDTFALTSSARFRRGMQLDQGFRTYVRYRDDTFAARSAKLVERLASQLELHEDRPTFGFLHIMDAHAPYDSPAPWGRRYLEGKARIPLDQTVQLVRRWREKPDELGAEKVAQLQQLYLGGVSHVDDHVRKIHALVEKSARPTLLVITSDHGEAFAENDYLGHSNVLWEETLRVPLLYWGPGVPAGQRLEVPTISADLMPTLTALAGSPAPSEFSGRDLSTAIRTGEAPPSRDLVVQANHRWGVVRANEDGVFKLLIDSATGNAVLHRADAPGQRESDTRIDDPALRASMLAELQGQDLSRPSERSELRDDITPQELDQLRALGYLDAEEH